jgi:pimeloyl-ACP methyl ester carboxylesterase
MPRIRVGEVEVAYDRAGKGAPVFLLHAAYLDRTIWFRTLPALSERFDAIAPDLPGHGESRAPPEWRPDMIPFLIELAAALGVERAHWIGSSFGGGLIIRLAAARPDLAGRLALFAPTGIPKREMDAVRQRLPKSKSSWEAFRETFEDPSLATRERYREFGRLQKLSAPFFRRYQATHPPDYATAGWVAEMRRIASPTLLVWGDRDRIIPPPMDRRTQEEIPGSRLVVLRGAGHFPFMDRPDQVTELLLGFLG